jgi:hypothetical protein
MAEDVDTWSEESRASLELAPVGTPGKAPEPAAEAVRTPPA